MKKASFHSPLYLRGPRKSLPTTLRLQFIEQTMFCEPKNFFIAPVSPPNLETTVHFPVVAPPIADKRGERTTKQFPHKDVCTSGGLIIID